MKSKEWLYGGRTHCPELRCEHLYGWWFTPIVDDHFHLQPIMKIIIYFLISIHLCFSIQRRDEFSLALFYFIPSQVLWKFHSGSRNLTASSPSLCKVGTCSQWTNRMSLLCSALHTYTSGRLAPCNAMRKILIKLKCWGKILLILFFQLRYVFKIHCLSQLKIKWIALLAMWYGFYCLSCQINALQCFR